MDNNINALLHVLNEELKIYNELLSLSRNKTDIIIKGKVTELDTMVKREQELIVELGGLESQREAAVDKIAQQLNINPSEITMSELVNRLEPVQAQELRKYQLNLTGILGELKELNDTNSKLIKNSLEFINFSINIMAGAPDTGNNYGGNGQVHDPGKRNLFDMKL